VLGICITGKQTILLFAAALVFMLFISKKTRRESYIFAVSALIPIAILLWWIYQHALWQSFFFWTVEFNYTIYPKLASQMPTAGQIVRFLFLWGATGYLYGQAKKKSFEHHILGISALALTIPAFGRFEFLHLQTALPVVLLLFTLVFSQTKFIVPKFLTKRHIDSGTLIFAFVLMMVAWHTVWYSKVRAGGSYLTSGDTPKIAEEIKKRTSDDDDIFILGGNPVLYALTNTLPAGNVYTVAVPWNYAVAQKSILKGLEDAKPNLVVVDTNTTIDGHHEEDFAKDVLEFIEENYEIEYTIDSYVFYTK
jgi:hypothetical protein